MKKYAIIIGENNPEVAGQVISALKNAGFKTEQIPSDPQIISVNTDSEGGCWWAKISDGIEFYTNIGGVKFILPSYVLAHAAELDGAKKPWEIPPEGHKFVTDQERKDFGKPIPELMYVWKNSNHKWVKSEDINGSRDWCSNSNYAVPVDFEFKKPEKEIEVGGKMYSESTLKNALREYVN